MGVSQKQWADMTAEERDAYRKIRQAQALALVENGEFPTGIPGSVIGKLLEMAADQKGVARPSGATDTGGVSYSVPRGLEVIAGGKRFRFNTGISISILGNKSSQKRTVSLPEGMEENLLEL